MAIVNVIGTFIGANLKKQEFEGKISYSVQLDVYQAENPKTDKMISVKVEDAEKLQQFQSQFKMGDPINLHCSISAYKNQAYFKFIDVLPIAN